MICVRWWELVLAVWAGEWISHALHIDEYSRRLGDRLASRLRQHINGPS